MSRYFDDSNSITHFGILGMKWGVRRYQNKDGSLKAAGKTRYKKGIRGAIQKYKNKKRMAKVRAAKVEKARQAEEREALKKKITSSAKELNKNRELSRELLTDQEYNKIRERLNNEQLVYDMSRKEKDRTRQAIERALDYSQTAVKAYNAYNAWSKILGLKSDNSTAKASKEVSDKAKSLLSEKRDKSKSKKDFQYLLDNLPDSINNETIQKIYNQKLNDDIAKSTEKLSTKEMEKMLNRQLEKTVPRPQDLPKELLYLVDKQMEGGRKKHVKHDGLDDVIQHFGILGMKWGVRRYQNKDGSLTSEGKKDQFLTAHTA